MHLSLRFRSCIWADWMFALPILRRFLERRRTLLADAGRPILSFELLEDRTVPANIIASTTNVYQVTSTADMGDGSLRSAIARVNADPLADIEIINFDILGSGVQSINVASDLQIQRAVTINGFSEDTAPGVTPGVLSIRLQGAPTATNGLVVTGSGSTIEGIEFVGFRNTSTSAGIALMGPGATNNTIVGDVFGTTREDIGGPGFSPTTIFGNGNSSRPNFANSVGIDLGNGADNNTIGGALASAANVISGNAQAGIVISDSDGNSILGNDIGVRGDGVTALGNAGPGIRIDNSNSTTITNNVIADNGTSPTFGNGVDVGSGDFNLDRVEFDPRQRRPGDRTREHRQQQHSPAGHRRSLDPARHRHPPGNLSRCPNRRSRCSFSPTPPSTPRAAARGKRRSAPI